MKARNLISAALPLLCACWLISDEEYEERLRVDADGDGFAISGSGELDCNDDNASVFPGAEETCNGLDDDCDGQVDEDASDAAIWYPDRDGDGYGGQLGYAWAACEQPADFADNANDCDDSAYFVYPGAEETCNGLDDDCDGEADEDASDMATWYPDVDGDGYGDAGLTCTACEQPSGHVSDDQDCDDGDASIHPEASEYCDGVDEDCDGVADDSALDQAVWWADVDGDGYGGNAYVVACEGPEGYTATDGDCDDSDASVHPDAEEVFYDGVDQDCDGAGEYDADADGYDSDEHGGVDCDDGDDGVHPGAQETLCDGIDQDCDGQDARLGEPGDTGYGELDIDDLVAGDIVLSEVMQNPDAVSDNDGEWFEIFNATCHDVELEGLVVSDAGSEVFTVARGLVVGAASYLLFACDANPAVNGWITPDYVYNCSDLSLSNGYDELILENATLTIDELAWDDGASFPDPTGASMSLDPTHLDAVENDDGAHWCEGSSVYGAGDLGTPGSANDACP